LSVCQYFCLARVTNHIFIMTTHLFAKILSLLSLWCSYSAVIHSLTNDCFDCNFVRTHWPQQTDWPFFYEFDIKQSKDDTHQYLSTWKFILRVTCRLVRSGLFSRIICLYQDRQANCIFSQIDIDTDIWINDVELWLSIFSYDVELWLSILSYDVELWLSIFSL